MAMCFIIQPFDEDAFDARYKDVYSPAIIAAGLTPYRVDRDLSVTKPIEEIERKIEDADICFADISTDNPNVWFEVGFAFACKKDVIMVCKEGRDQFPFDVRHRSILSYKTNSTSDFTKLQKQITEKLQALIKKSAEIIQIKSNIPIKDTQGLSPYEFAFLTVLFSEMLSPLQMVLLWNVRSDMEKSGFNKMATNLALQKLIQKKFVSLENDVDVYGNDSPLVKILQPGIDWLLANEDKLEIMQPGLSDEVPF